MTFWQVCALGLVAIIFLYVGARVVSAAYFKSKQDHEATRKVPK